MSGVFHLLAMVLRAARLDLASVAEPVVVRKLPWTWELASESELVWD